MTALALLCGFLTAGPAIAEPPAPADRSGSKAPAKPVATAAEVVPVPADAAGSPTSSTIARADQLHIAVTDPRSGQTSTSSFEPTWDLGGGSDGTLGRQPGPRTDLNQNYPTASGRFLDPVNDRAVAMRHVKLGDQALWQLGTTDDAQLTTENRSSDEILAVPGSVDFSQRTVVFSSITGAGSPSAKLGSGGLGQPLAGTEKVNGSTEVDQHWTMVPAADSGAAGWYRLVSRADGLCMDLFNNSTDRQAQVGTWTCNRTDSDNQQPGGDPVPAPPTETVSGQLRAVAN